MPEMPPAPNFEAMNGPKPEKALIGLDKTKIDGLKNGKTEKGLGESSAQYFEAMDGYLKAQGDHILALEKQNDNLPQEVQKFAKGVTELQHVTRKDGDRVLGRVLALKMVEAAEAQHKAGTTAIPDSAIQSQIAEMQLVWNRLSDRAKAQTMRGLRRVVTDNSFWDRAVVNVDDWTLKQTFHRRDKQDFKVVLDDMADYMSNGNHKFGAEKSEAAIKVLKDRLTDQINSEGANMTTRISEGIKGMREGIGVVSVSPDVQQEVGNMIKELEDAQKAYGEAKTEAQGADWKTPTDAMKLQDAVDASVKISTTIDKILATRRKQGRTLAGAVGLQVAEAKAVIPGNTVGEWWAQVDAGLDIRKRLGLFESNATIKLGETQTGEIRLFDTIIRKTGMLGGERYTRQAMLENSTAQLDAMHELASGKFSEKMKPHLETVRDQAAGIAEKQAAMRALKEMGVVMIRIHEVQSDVAGFQKQSEPPKDMTPEMDAAWLQLKDAAGKLETAISKYTAVEVQPDLKTTQSVANLAEKALEHQIETFGLEAGNVPELFDQKQYEDWIIGMKKGWLGNKLRTATRAVWSRRSPTRLTGVSYDSAKKKYKVTGLGMEVAKGLQGATDIIEGKDSLATAFSRNGQTSKLHSEIAIYMTRLGLGNAGERLRTLFSKEHDVRGMEASMLSTRINNVLHTEEAVAFAGAGTLLAFTAPEMANFVGDMGDKLATFANSQAEAARSIIDSVKDRIAMLNNTAVSEASQFVDEITGPNMVTNTDIANVAHDAGEQALDAMKVAAQSDLTSAEDKLTWMQRLSSVGDFAMTQGYMAMEQGKELIQHGSAAAKTLEIAAMGAGAYIATEVGKLPRKALDKLFPKRGNLSKLIV